MEGHGSFAVIHHHSVGVAVGSESFAKLEEIAAGLDVVSRRSKHPEPIAIVYAEMDEPRSHVSFQPAK